MLFATSVADMTLFLLIVIPLAMLGMKKSWGVFDKDGKVHDATQKGVVGLIERWFKK